MDEGNLQFQKLEFNVEKAGSDEAKVQRKKTKQVLLKEAIKKKARAAEDGGNEVAWEDAFNRADGKKVFDDPKKLSKVSDIDLSLCIAHSFTSFSTFFLLRID